MSPEVSIFGVYVPSLLLCAPPAFLLAALLKQILALLGMYRFVWHKGLFDVAVFICSLGVVLQILSKVSRR